MSEKKFISFSGGVESRTMAVLFGNKADAIFADTGAEHDELYKQLDHVEQKIREFHGNDFKIIKLQAKDVEGTGANTLIEYIKYRKYFPSFGRRYCTALFKIKPIDNYLQQFSEVELMIGLNSDEADLRTGNYGLMANVKYSYPLIDNGITRKMCYEILDAVGINPNFPAYMKRGGCKCCYFKSKREFEAMAILNEKEYDEVAELESTIQDKRDQFFHLAIGVPNLKDFKAKAKSVLFNSEEIYPVINNVTKCGVFCNR
jgi:3'-phosphoadenosine 5'-phosphosulfate sulfotransferase (PAPS reductase)/FAD synthetase